jgi:hypothetical protein
MAKYRKKVIVDAQEATADGQMTTRTGVQQYKQGDFIITNPDGERYPCPRDVFFLTYKPENGGHDQC